MVEIVKQKNKVVRVSIKVCENATPGSWGSHQLLLDEYRCADPTRWTSTPDGKAVYEQMMFNTAWLEYMLEKYGELHCEYCGKPHLKINPWWLRPDLEVLATTDHFHPQKTHPHLCKETKNFVVACHRCNNNKKAKHFDKSSIKYPYPEVRIF